MCPNQPQHPAPQIRYAGASDVRNLQNFGMNHEVEHSEGFKGNEHSPPGSSNLDEATQKAIVIPL